MGTVLVQMRRGFVLHCGFFCSFLSVMQDIPALNLMRERVVVIYVAVLLCEVAFVVLLLKRKVGNKIFVKRASNKAC